MNSFYVVNKNIIHVQQKSSQTSLFQQKKESLTEKRHKKSLIPTKKRTRPLF